MTYDLETIRAELLLELQGEGKISQDFGRTIIRACAHGLLEDADIGRAVRAAAERDGPERVAMARAAMTAEVCYYPDEQDLGALKGEAQAAARAIIDFVKEKAGE